MKLEYSFKSMNFSIERRGECALYFAGIDGEYTFTIREQATNKLVFASKRYKLHGACIKAGRKQLARLAGTLHEA